MSSKIDFKENANVIPMMEKLIMQVLRRNKLLTGNKTFGIVEEIINDTTLLVELQQSNTSEEVNCSPETPFHRGDRVIVEYINNNPQDRFVMGLIGGGNRIEQMNYANLPTEPVEIIRNDKGQAYRFIYAYDKPNKTWSQEITRNENNQAEIITHFYPDGFVMARFIKRNEEGLVTHYE